MYSVGYMVFWLVMWLQTFLWLSFFFSLVVSDYEDSFLCFLKWYAYTVWYVYFMPFSKFGFSSWQSWIYFYRYSEFISPDWMQWWCEATPWLIFMFFYVFLCFFYEWSLKNSFDNFLIFILVVLFLTILTV